ncbi:peptidoglycan-binding protein LysM [Hyphobacterium sp.]|uniref:peptidoglycan-binding protein LysM n=1 Tax=Hyphobacterium sp. TaxID=2004662 RepID=UPI003BA8FFE9
MFGLIQVVAQAGRALGIGEGKSEEEEAEIVRNEVKEQNLEGAEKVDFEVKKGKVVVKGEGVDQAIKEKILMAAGNIKGIGEVEDKIIAAKKAAAGKFYTVKSGDSLSKISKSQYGDAMKYPEIFEANKPMLKHPDKIYPGQVLRIPPKK